ncbi:hypothetical protein JMUB7532_27580 [Staphylococcus aureus]
MSRGLGDVYKRQIKNKDEAIVLTINMSVSYTHLTLPTTSRV